MNSTKRILKAAIRRSLNAVGYDIVRYNEKNMRARMARLLAQYNISTVLDVGANRGDFGWNMRELGYRGRIVSFEPMRDPFLTLAKAAYQDPAWQAVNIGLGDRNETREINVAANSQSSSLLPMLNMHLEAAPESRYEKQERVTIFRLDDFLKDHHADETMFLKVDTQGFEKNVIDGARGILEAVPLIQLECSFVALYEGAQLIECMVSHMRGLGYDPIDAFPVFYHRDNGHLMQPDVLFLRRQAGPGPNNH